MDPWHNPGGPASPSSSTGASVSSGASIHAPAVASIPLGTHATLFSPGQPQPMPSAFTSSSKNFGLKSGVSHLHPMQVIAEQDDDDDSFGDIYSETLEKPNFAPIIVDKDEGLTRILRE
jgi:hypothetical protein